MWLHITVRSMHSWRVDPSFEWTLCPLRSFGLGAFLLTYQIAGRLLLLCLRDPRTSIGSCSVLRGIRYRHDWSYRVSTEIHLLRLHFWLYLFWQFGPWGNGSQRQYAGGYPYGSGALWCARFTKMAIWCVVKWCHTGKLHGKWRSSWVSDYTLHNSYSLEVKSLWWPPILWGHLLSYRYSHSLKIRSYVSNRRYIRLQSCNAIRTSIFIFVYPRYTENTHVYPNKESKCCL